MASTMYEILNDNNDGKGRSDTWDPLTMHICCFCHKLALIVNAGLEALSLKTLPPGKTKESVLGFFPVLHRVTKEDKPEEFPVQGNNRSTVNMEQQIPGSNLEIDDDGRSADDDYNGSDENSEIEEESSSEDDTQKKTTVPAVINPTSQQKHTKTLRLNTTNNTSFAPGKNGNLSGGKLFNFLRLFLQNASGVKIRLK
ncbi:uncharacterized protein PGTG_21967 [Puccinia graminis f. sp. tritici CRL 75-36-700-3]|uniref:Uncharacterized protein n=1 Tax=Puccinia graminis f. sp. tritici (strain CRL 75-36-700-3 / race SCCL) TaxID=418459 RepID=H6QSZ7_PUCGT|nr:uncharacterized protein PGTG_21967 [Puccinia graminis f. sp. tritici CRL 75-36-700-3]EHS63951.1 hypothetical protein PGTG_21967 [Puccinia graminis f. sp. tritici CRL 75-36-700-3]